MPTGWRLWIERAGGTIEKLEGCDAAELEAGDIFAIQAPTDGGYGSVG